MQNTNPTFYILEIEIPPIPIRFGWHIQLNLLVILQAYIILSLLVLRKKKHLNLFLATGLFLYLYTPA